MRGSLVLVTGPSGAGKDSIIDAARRHFARHASLVFARRAITRAAGSGGEAHEAVGVAEFGRRQRAGLYMLSWRAHGLSYGIARDYAEDLVTGKSVIANVSRTVIGHARTRFQPVAVVCVTAPPHILKQRLAGRDREIAADQEKRLGRIVAAELEGRDVVTIQNDGPLAAAAERLIGFLEPLARDLPAIHATS
jgi:phosphonate metabolism protein PhnN/1,5-bisphosphokinase (PRPP-forming)